MSEKKHRSTKKATKANSKSKAEKQNGQKDPVRAAAARKAWILIRARRKSGFYDKLKAARKKDSVRKSAHLAPKYARQVKSREATKAAKVAAQLPATIKTVEKKLAATA